MPALLEITAGGEMMPEQNKIGYADAAFLYKNAGWTSPLPVNRFTKDIGLPSGYTGNLGIDPSGADIQSWCEERPLDNCVLRMPDNVIGIDIDAYDGKNGAQTLAEAKKRWGALPEAPKATSRDQTHDPHSGIIFFRVPAGTAFEDRISFPELGLGHIEIIQRVHRYAVVWPSIHPNGPTYWWYNASRQLIPIPNVEDLPELPQNWIDALHKKTNNEKLDFGHADIDSCLTTGSPSPRVAARLAEAIRDINTGSESRHDVMLKHVLTILRYGKDGDPGVHSALQGLMELFVAAIATGPHARPGMNRELAIAEFRRMITNDRAAQLLAAPSHDEWMRGLATEVAQSIAQENLPPAKPEPKPAAPAAAPAGDATITSNYHTHFQEQLELIEQGFWNSRQSLRTIFDSAVARMAPPWSVLAVCAARALCLVPPKIVLPPIIGGPASLNQFFGLVSPSGGGKGISGAVGKELVPNFVNERKLGSPEGLLKPFIDNPKDPEAKLEAIWFNMAEIDGFRGVGSRNRNGGTDLIALLRECWDGASVGFGWLDNVFVEAHTYRITLTVGIQPLRAGWLLSDTGGTPQRFMWFPATDERANRRNWNKGFWIPCLNLPSALEFKYPRTLTIPAEAEQMIVDAQEQKNFRQMDALDGHAVQARERFAYALSVLDGRSEMSSEDWELSGIAALISTFTREWCKDGAKAGAVAEAEERGVLRGVESFAADLEKDQRHIDNLQRVIRWVLKKLGEAGEDGVSQTDLGHAIAGRDRKMLALALERATTEGLVRAGQVDGSQRWWKL